MSITIVILAVLFAAFLHALWNTVVKGHNDKLLMMLMIAVVQLSIAVIMVPFLGFPSEESWPWLLATAIPHTTYKIALAKAYDVGDMTVVYPISRGLSIILVTSTSILILGESISLLGLLGIITITSGVFALSIRKNETNIYGLKKEVIFLCFAAGISVALYTILDSIGVRVSEKALTLTSIATFAAWLFIFDGLGMIIFAIWIRGGKVLLQISKTGVSGIFAGCTAFTCYWIAIWALAYAPVALVASLRETSVLFSLIFGKLYLSESVGRERIVFAVVILSGIVLLRFS